jgi:methanethiol S-methyltransferase
MLKRSLYFLYGLISYMIFLATFLYAVAFVGGFWVPSRLAGALTTLMPLAIGVDCLLLTVFALQHSIMARR